MYLTVDALGMHLLNFFPLSMPSNHNICSMFDAVGWKVHLTVISVMKKIAIFLYFLIHSFWVTVVPLQGSTRWRNRKRFQTQI